MTHVNRFDEAVALDSCGLPRCVKDQWHARTQLEVRVLQEETASISLF
jgi:hypothetical protein